MRGSLLERTTFHSNGCPKCARGEGHPQWVLNVNYPGAKTRQLSLRPDQVPQVREARQVMKQARARVLEGNTRSANKLLSVFEPDAGFFSAANEAEAKALGVKRVAVPNRSTKSAKRKTEQKKRWFKKAQKWRTGCEGRISILKRRHGLNRSRYKGTQGMKRWVGLGVMADT